MLFFPRSNLMQWLNIVSMMLKSCYNHILTLYFWGSVLQWSTIKTKYPNFTFFSTFLHSNHGQPCCQRRPKTCFRCSTMVSRILIDMLEPYPDIAALKEYPTMVYHCILFLRMSDLPWENLLLPWLWQWLTMFLLHYGYILDHEYGI